MFCQGSETILTEFIKDRLNIKGVASIVQTLKDKGVPGEKINHVMKFIRTCQSGRYSPGEMDSNRNKMKAELLIIIKGLKKWI